MRVGIVLREEDLAEAARSRLAAAMATAYGLPFERFERYCPCGPPETIARALIPYAELGCRSLNLVPVARSLVDAINDAAEVKKLLSTTV